MPRLLSIAIAISVIALPLAAFDPYLVKDINRAVSPLSSSPADLITVGDLVYFSTDYQGAPRELWRTDGTEAGTFKIADGGYNKVVWRGKLWFQVVRPSNELWSTDGTIAGTQRLTLPAGVIADPLMATSEHLYFVNDTRLWRIDASGIPAQVSDLSFGIATSRTWTALNDSLFFIGNGGGSPGFWRANSSGVSLVFSVPAESRESLSAPFTAGDLVYVQRKSQIFFGTKHELWRSDGTTEGSFPLKPGAPIRMSDPSVVVAGSSVYFNGDDGSGRKLWRTDGSDSGTTVVASSLPGASANFNALPFGALANGTLLFLGPSISPAASEGGLWAFDGSSTSFLGRVSTYSSRPPATVVGNTAFFNSENSLWKTDGTALGTSVVRVFPNPSLGYWPMAARGGDLLFAGYDSETGTEPWITDGTASNTRIIKDVFTATHASRPASLTAFRGGILFSAEPDASGSRGLWFSDGTENGTRQLAAFSRFIRFSGVATCNDLGLYFDLSAERELQLWATDGTPEGTAPLRSLYPGEPMLNSFELRAPTCVNGTAFFHARSDSGKPWALWRSDGTPAGTLLMSQLDYAEPASMVAFNNALYFDQPGALWRSDGTNNGTRVIKRFESYDSWLSRIFVSGGSMFFATSSPGERSLWKSDGTAENTTRFLTSTGITVFGAFNGSVIFDWRPTPFPVKGLCASDGTEPRCFGASSSNLRQAELNRRLYYLPLSSSLYVTDGYSETFLESNVGLLLTTAGGRLYTRMTFPTSGSRLKAFGGSTNEEALLPYEVTAATGSGGRLFISADELYAYDLPVAALAMTPRRIQSGGPTISISGRGFTAPATVRVGAADAATTFISATGVSFVAPDLPAGSYPVELTLGDGRHIVLDDVLVYARSCNGPTAAVAVAPAPVTAGTTVQLSGSGGVRCAWFPATGLDDTSSCSPRATVQRSVTYTLIVFDESGCESTNHPTVRVAIAPAAPPGISASVTSSRTSVEVSWLAVAAADRYEVVRTTEGGAIRELVGSVGTNSFVDSSIAAGQAYLYEVRAVSDIASAYSKGDFASTVVLTDDALSERLTPIRAAHILELRSVIDRFRRLAGLQPFNWTDPILTQRVSALRVAHVLELRSALAEAYSAARGLSLSFPPIVRGDIVRATTLRDLRTLLR